jgi:hypothetical protein
MSYIKLDRDLLYSYCFANPNHLKIWIWLLIKANFKNAFIPLNVGKGFKTIEVKRGQLIFGRNKAEEELGLNGSLIYRTLLKFQELGQINIEVNNHFSVITICNYDSYQSKSDEVEQAMNSKCTADEQQMNNRRTTDEQQMNIYKEELEEKESKEERIILRGKKFLSSDFNELPDHYLTTSIQLIKIQKKIDLTNDEVFKMWEVFKTQNLTGETHYNSENKVYLHFTNWLKTQKFEYGTTKTRQQTTNDSLEYITNKGAELYAKLYGSDSQS